ncbi:thioesterase domain-containing protein [Aspergillus lucknowensis]|uniref:Alpha/Beta hydrolase protein n=1 Tax=Aspergillus lucknowensis TaxID=176173 RepID=A0ABR4LXD7_9EURO
MDSVVHIQGNPDSPLTPLILIHAISGLALPYFALGSLSPSVSPEDDDDDEGRPVYGISSPIFESPSAFRRHAKSLPSLALEYVRILRRDIQARGPYLLGGWSMGGMIAIEMAAILVAQGEQVKHVVMIDSLNPELYPPFQDAQEHRVLSTLTYNAIAWRIDGSEDPPTATSMAPSGDSSTVTSSNNSRENSDYGSGSDSDDENLDGQTSTAGFMQQIREHVNHGLRMLAAYPSLRRRPYLPETEVTLIKCTLLDNLSPLLRDGRRAFARKNKLDPRCGWREEQFKSFMSVPFAATHDGCFDAGVSGKLTAILRDVLRDTV